MDVALIGPAGTFVGEAVLDTGADDTVFPERAATIIGIDLPGAPELTVQVVGGATVTARFALVSIRLSDGRESREWVGWVGFTAAPMRRALLGITGCLQFFDASFFGAREVVALEVNALYQGT